MDEEKYKIEIDWEKIARDLANWIFWIHITDGWDNVHVGRMVEYYKENGLLPIKFMPHTRNDENEIKIYQGKDFIDKLYLTDPQFRKVVEI